MKKVWKFLGSMQFAMILLVVLILACAGGSFITQGLSYERYAQLYSERAAGLIVGLGLDDVFHSWWFLVITAFLCGNLLLCNLIRLPQLLKRYRQAADPLEALEGPVTVSVQGVEDPAALLEKLRMPKAATARDSQGREVLYSVRNRIGLWGAWVCHLGIFLLILGFALGQMTKEEYTVYGVPGQTRQIGDTDYYLEIKDFRVDYHDDGSVEQYTADVSVYDESNPEDVLGMDASVSVNNPGSCFGFKLYQNSTGDAATLSVWKDGALQQQTPLCVGEGAYLMGTPVSVLLQSYLPDYETYEDGSPRPGYAYIIYTGEDMYTMNVQREGETIPDLRPYEVSFSDPQPYTLIQVKRDRFTPLALVGGLVTMIGLILAFYLQLRKVWALRQEDGAWTVCGHSPKGGALFADRFREAAEKQ